jgi:hypothetical protein
MNAAFGSTIGKVEVDLQLDQGMSEAANYPVAGPSHTNS